METKTEVLSRIKALSQSVIESEENANNLVDLLGYLQVYQIRTQEHDITMLLLREHTAHEFLSTHPHWRNQSINSRSSFPPFSLKTHQSWIPQSVWCANSMSNLWGSITAGWCQLEQSDSHSVLELLTRSHSSIMIGWGRTIQCVWIDSCICFTMTTTMYRYITTRSYSTPHDRTAPFRRLWDQNSCSD